MQKHLQRLLLIAAMLLVPWVTQAQTLDEYSFSTGTDTSKWIAVPTTLTSLITPGAGDYGVSSVHNLGFSFPFGENSYTQFSVNSDGNLKFGSSVTGTSNYSSPFSSSNASVNNPKINFFGCDGYCNNSHYVRYLHTADTNGDSLGVVEFCMGTYTSTTRSYLYKWQVHLYHNGKIEVVYGVAPSTAPDVSRQQGLCINASDGWLVNASNAASHFTAGSSATIASGNWPTEGRYYTFERPNLACPKPVQLILTSLGTTEASFVWVDTTGSGSWLVRLDSTDMGTPTEVYDTSIYITDLSANTEYTFNVANLCPSGDTSAWRSFSFRTPCTFLDSLPFFYGFEGVSTGTSAEFPYCWARLNNGTDYGYYPYVSNSSTYNHTPGGSNGLYWYNNTTTGTYGDYQIVVLPGVDTDIYAVNTLQVRFWAKSSSASYYPLFYVGVMSNPNDVTTFQYLDTINVGNNTNWQEYESLLNGFHGNGNFVAIRANRPSSYWYAYVDDITLEVIPACPRTSELTQTDATLNSVTISWTEMGEATQWVVEYDTVNFVPGTGGHTVEYATSIPYTINGLDSAHNYYIYLHADCGGDTSDNRFILASTLASSPASLPFYCNFECDNNCGWELLNGNQTNAWYVGTAVNNGGNKSLYISNNNGASNAYSTSTISYAYAYRTIDFTDSGEFAYSYDWRSQGESHNYDFTRVFLAPAGYQWPVNDNPAGSTYNFASWSCPAGWIELTEQFGSPANLAQSSSWRTVTGTFQLQSPGIYNLVFAWANDGSGGTQPPTAIDNVSIIHNTCPAPVLHGINVGVSTADISWDEIGDASLWYFECDTVVANPGDGLAQFSLSLNDTSVSLTGLDSGTMYYYYIWSLCDAGDSSLVLSGSFTTLVGAPATAPYFCDFEHAGNNGWTLDNGSQTNKWYVGNTVNHGGSRSMYVSDNNGVSHSYSGSESYVFASRTFNLTDTGEYSYSFDWLCNGEGSYDFIRVALVPVSVTLTPGSYSGFDNTSAMPSGSIALDNAYRMNLQSSWQTRTGTFYLHNPGTYNWVFLWRNDGSVYNQPPAAIDNVALSRNTCPSPQNLTSTHVTGDSIVITWAPGGDETEWAVITDSTTVYVYDTTYALDELNANTSYSISVRAICGDGDTSLPVSINVRTSCGAITVLPYIEDFESYPDGASSYAPPECGIPCWSRLDNASQYHFGYIGSRSSWPSGGHSGTGFLYYYMPTTTGTYADWIITVLPPIDSTVHPLNTLQMSFWVKMNSTSTSGDIVIGAMTNPTVASTFTPIDTVHVAGNIYQMKEAYFSQYTGPGEYIALKYTRNSSTTTYYFVDDIVVEPIPDCPPVSGIALGLGHGWRYLANAIPAHTALF